MNTYSHFHKFEAWDPAGKRAVVWVPGEVLITLEFENAVHAKLDAILEGVPHAAA